VRDAAKYEHMRDFCRALPGLRAQVQHDIVCRCLCKEKVVATVVALIERAHLRVGNDEYTKANGSYGATTLEGRHARVRGSEIVLSYRAKSGKRRAIRFRDARLARVIRQCKAIPGARLFRWRDGRRTAAVTSTDVNAYLHEHGGDAVSAKDFRTWAATVAAAIGLAREPVADSTAARKRTVAKVIEQVAVRLGNTPAVCKKSYVHPLLVERYVAGDLKAPLSKLRRLSNAARVEQRVIAMLQ
jgi:DNA topoisomerase-1